jgi:GGDEF domain-containing protein
LPHTFVVTRGGRYRGVGKTLSLLRRITEQQIVAARYANPLTLLPGGVPICEHIDGLLWARADFHVAYCDLNHFKPYNDIFGYARGDEVIRFVGELLSRHSDPRRDFLGHVGGDDFVLVLCSDDWQLRCEQILAGFERGVRQFYPPDVLAAGTIVCEDRRGTPQNFPLLGLAIGVVHPNPDDCNSHYDVSELAAHAKHEAKKISGSGLFVSRRRRISAAGAMPRNAAGNG